MALHSRARDYLPNVTKADLRNTLGAGPFTLDQVQEVFSKRTKQVCAATACSLCGPQPQ